MGRDELHPIFVVSMGIFIFATDRRPPVFYDGMIKKTVGGGWIRSRSF
jgi:hypothetical protein